MDEEKDQKVWALGAAAILLGLAFWKMYDADNLGIYAAFFTIVGDLLALLALGRASRSDPT